MTLEVSSDNFWWKTKIELNGCVATSRVCKIVRPQKSIYKAHSCFQIIV